MAESGFRKKMYAFAPIPHSVCQDKNLSDKALGMYCRIFSYIHIPNFELTKSFLMSVSPSGETAFNSEWKELKEKGYLKQFRICDKKGVFRYEYDLMDEPDLTTPYLINVGTNGEVTSDSNSEKAEVDTPQNHPPKNHPYGRHTGGKIGYPNKNKQIRISNNKELNISNDIFNEKNLKNDNEVEEIEEEKPQKANKRNTFIPPTLDEVTEYCKERGNNIDPEEFIAHYTCRDWYIGKTNRRMKDWKSAVVVWEKNELRYKQDFKPQYGKQNKEPTGMDALKELADEWGVQLP
jgi:hypothetical protein